MDLSWRYGLKDISFRNKTFLFFKIESWNFQYLLEIEFHETSQKFQLIQLIQIIAIFIFSMGCLIELKLCELSQNSFSIRFWKIQLSILKNKKVLFLKKIYFLSRCQYQNKKTLFTGSIFREGFGVYHVPRI